MKTTAFLVSFGLLVAGSPLSAEPFNKRGIDYRTAAPAGSYQPSPPVSPEVEAFKRRDDNYIVEAPKGSAKPLPPVPPSPSPGFKRRDYHEHYKDEGMWYYGTTASPGYNR